MERWKVFDGHQVTINDEPPSWPSTLGKWYWLRQAIASTPLETWMSITMPNRKEALRAQSSINNKYIKEPLREDGKLIRTRVVPADGEAAGPWKVHWYVWRAD